MRICCVVMLYPFDSYSRTAATFVPKTLSSKAPIPASLTAVSTASSKARPTDPAVVEREHGSRQNQLDELFAGSHTTPASAIYVIARDRLDGAIAGAAIVETPVLRILHEDPHADGPGLRQTYSLAHRILGGIAVAPPHRGKELGANILEEAAVQALTAGARHLDGFVDHWTGSAGFYEAEGFLVTPHNTPLPPRPPTYVTS